MVEVPGRTEVDNLPPRLFDPVTPVNILPVAVAPEWPGLERGAKNEQTAIESLLSYVPRYASITKLAGMDAAFARSPVVNVVEKFPGTGSTDFWGISFAFSSIDKQGLSVDELERELRLSRHAGRFSTMCASGCLPKCRKVREAEDVIGIISSGIRSLLSRIGRR